MEFPAWPISLMAALAFGLLARYRPMPPYLRTALGIPLIFLCAVYLWVPFVSITDARVISRLVIFTILMDVCIVLALLLRQSVKHG